MRFGNVSYTSNEFAFVTQQFITTSDHSNGIDVVLGSPRLFQYLLFWKNAPYMAICEVQISPAGCIFLNASACLWSPINKTDSGTLVSHLKLQSMTKVNYSD